VSAALRGEGGGRQWARRASGFVPGEGEHLAPDPPLKMHLSPLPVRCPSVPSLLLVPHSRRACLAILSRHFPCPPSSPTPSLSMTVSEFNRITSTVLNGLKSIITNFSGMASQISGPVAIVAKGSEIARYDSAGAAGGWGGGGSRGPRACGWGGGLTCRERGRPAPPL
jgi:hypothetical protein